MNVWEGYANFHLIPITRGREAREQCIGNLLDVTVLSCISE